MHQCILFCILITSNELPQSTDVPRPLCNDIWVFLHPNIDAERKNESVGLEHLYLSNIEG